MLNKIASGNYLNNNGMESYKLLDLSGSESDNDIIHFAPVPDHPHPQRKKRLKRRERDQLRISPSLVDEELTISGSSSSLPLCCGCTGCLPSMGGSGGYWGGGNNSNMSPWEVVRSALLLVALVGLAILTWLALHLQARLDATQMLITAVEASSTELPGKFHESHVRLQELEKNQTALWEALGHASASINTLLTKVGSMESDVDAVKSSLSSDAGGQLSALPKNVHDLQEAVATFGSTLQDVQSSLKLVKKDHDSLAGKVKNQHQAVEHVKEDLVVLHNETRVSAIDDVSASDIGSAVTSLRQQVSHLTTTIATINTTVAHDGTQAAHSLQSMVEASSAAVGNLTSRVSSVEAACASVATHNLPARVTNLSTAMAQLQATADQQQATLTNLTQTVDMVKGVEHKIEGSQVQLASSVSELKQQLHKVGQQVTSMSSASESASSDAQGSGNTTHKRNTRLTQPESAPSESSRGPG